MLQAIGAVGAFPWLGGLRAGGGADIVVDFQNRVASTSPLALGYNVTTFTRTAIDSPALAAAEKRLDARYVRIPIGMRGGRVTSGASGGPITLDGPSLIRWYQERGTRVLVVLAGATNDVDVRTGDVARLLRMMSSAGVDLHKLEISSPNEPNNQKLTLEESIALATRCSDEARQVVPGKRLWGPAWTWYNRNALRKFASAMGDRLDGIDFHHYAMGVTSLPTAEALAQTPTWGKEISEVRQDLKALSLPDRVSASELNFSWRFEDGTPPDGKNRRFFTAVNTVWCASVVGHILMAGGSAAVYGNQNGALGVFTEDPAASPMPAFLGLAAWTGAGFFSHFGDAFFEVHNAAPPNIEAFAVSNVAGGRNVVLINKSEMEDAVVDFSVVGLSPRSVAVWQSSPEMPTLPPRRLAGGSLRETRLPRMSVTTVVIS